MANPNLDQLLSALDNSQIQTTSLRDANAGLFRTVKITGIALDSRQVQPGNVFVAIQGGSIDGHNYIADAISRGAATIVGERSLDFGQVPYIRVNDSRMALAYLSAAFYGYPARELTVIGVTGTDGKTTTCNLIYNILKTAGVQAGMISTVSAMIGDKELDTGFHVTTPEAQDVQQYLMRMVKNNLTHVVLEATSHGLAQHRVTACEFDAGVVTNITHEHLDFHGSYGAYREAKGRLISHLADTGMKKQGNPRLAVLNRDDASFDYLSSRAHSEARQMEISIHLVTYGFSPEADLRAVDYKHSSDGSSFRAISKDFDVPVTTPLQGEYNVSNCLAALGATVTGLGVDIQAACQGIASLSAIPGRMERIDLGQAFLAYVDFAHTPNALKNALQAARAAIIRENRDEKLIAIFGSAGLRDREKRRLMAEISAELADLTILTAEDPRTEDLDDILTEMAQGIMDRTGVEGKTFWRIPDRGEAIRFGVNKARPGDLVISLGKGHEQSMCFGETEYPWDDRTAMRAALAERLGISGPEMPSLPTSLR